MAKRSYVKFLGASAAILAAIVSWVIMAEKLQKVNEQYKKPYFITYWVHGVGYSSLYVAWQLWLIIPVNVECVRVGEGVWTGRAKQLVIVSWFLAIISFTSAYSWYYSLPRTNIPANTAIYQSACVWVFLLSIFLLRERITVLKIAAVVVSVVGVVMVAVFSSTGACGDDGSASGSVSEDMSDITNSTAINFSSTTGEPSLGHIHRGGSCTERSTFPGYIALFYSVISYALFEVGYNKWGSEENDPASVQNSLRMLGYLGIQTLIWLWPGLIILHYSGTEPFEWPPYDIFILLLWNTLLDIVFNAGLLICIALSSALFASVGTILVIPAAILVDWMMQGFLLQTAAAFGVVFIIIGFIGFLTSEIIAIIMKNKESVDKDTGHHLQEAPNTCRERRGKWEEEEEEGERGSKETSSFLSSRQKKPTRKSLIKYLF